jgi:hypothetical protein
MIDNSNIKKIRKGILEKEKRDGRDKKHER